MRFIICSLAALWCCFVASPVGAIGPFLVFFDSGAERPNRYGDAILDNAILWLRHNKVTRLKLIGSADRQGSAEYNLRLSRRRAEVVKAALARRGFPADGIEVVAMGETQLLVETPDGVAEEQNRYVALLLVALGDPASPQP